MFGRYIVAGWEGRLCMWCSDCGDVEPGSNFWGADEGDTCSLLEIISHALAHEHALHDDATGHPPLLPISTVTIPDCE